MNEQTLEISISVSEAEHTTLMSKAHDHGFGDVASYLLALARQDSIEKELFEDEDIDIEANFREAWRQAMEEEGYPYDKLDELLNCKDYSRI
jgi:hypothetical protein